MFPELKTLVKHTFIQRWILVWIYSVYVCVDVCMYKS